MAWFKRKPAVVFKASPPPKQKPLPPTPPKTTAAPVKVIKPPVTISPLGPGNPAWNKPVIVATTDGRGSLSPPISDPRAATTTTPLKKATQDLPSKWASLAPRMPDRGAYVPVNGQRTPLPSGYMGGIPRMPAPLQSGIEKSALFRASLSVGQSVMTTVKKSINAQRLAEKMKIHLVPGGSGLHQAKAGPLRVDPRNGKVLFKWHIGQQTREKSERGVFSQHLTVPKSAVDLMAEARKMRAYSGVPNLNVRRDGAGNPEPQKGRINDTTVAAAPITGITLGPQRDQESLPIRPAPSPSLTIGETEGGNNMKQMLFLGAAVLIGYMILKRKAA